MIETKQKPKLSRIPRGYWRNVWSGPAVAVKETPWGDNHLGAGHYISAEQAEQAARNYMATPNLRRNKWLGCEFFPA